MKEKIIEFGIVIFAICLILYFTLSYGKKLEKDRKTIIEQKKEIREKEQLLELQNEIIETKNNQQKIIIKTSNINDYNSRNEWLQLIFKERENNN